MARPQSCRNLAILSVALCFAAGCETKYYSISGTVKVDGKPFANGSINLIPVGEGRPAYGGTDADGRFNLDTGNTKGAPKGTYKLVLQKFETSGPPQDEKVPGELRKPMKSTFLEKYSKPETSDITVEVPSANGNYDFDVSSK